MCLNEPYSRVWVGNHLSDMFSIKKGWKQGEALSFFFVNYAVEYVIKRV